MYVSSYHTLVKVIPMFVDNKKHASAIPPRQLDRP